MSNEPARFRNSRIERYVLAANLGARSRHGALETDARAIAAVFRDGELRACVGYGQIITMQPAERAGNVIMVKRVGVGQRWDALL